MMFKIAVLFIFVTVGTIFVLHQAFKPDENNEYLPTAFQQPPAEQASSPYPTPMPTRAPVLACYPQKFAPDQTGYSTTVTIVEIHDGDTVTVDNGAGLHVTKLWGMDAPELQQPHGPAARDALAQLLTVGRHAAFYEVFTDPITPETYGIFVADDRFVNIIMLGNGHAYPSNHDDAQHNECIQGFTDAAKQRGYGVWADGPDGHVRPWQYLGINTPTPAPTMPPTPEGTRRIPQQFNGTPTPYPTEVPPDDNTATPPGTTSPTPPEQTPQPTPTPTPEPDISTPSNTAVPSQIG